MQDLIETEAAEVVGGGRYERSEGRVTQRNATDSGPGCSRPRPGTWSCGSRSCGRARSSPSSSNVAGPSTRPCMR